jgi:succinoglycan biosynthesis transport protein ExoP
MTDSFDPIEYLEYLRKRWRFTAVAVLLAGTVAVALCLVLPKQYTAVATLIIEPPGGDPRSTTAVSSIYLESLKSYEAFASSDSLFAKACKKFRLLDGKNAPSLESFKRRVLRVDKLKDTNVLEVSATLPEPAQAQALVEYLAQETVALDRGIARAGDQELLESSRRQMEAARKELDEARTEAASAARPDEVLGSEVQSLVERKAAAEARRIEANMALAESSARDGQESAGAGRAGIAALTADIAAIERDLDAKAATLSALRARRQRADDRVRSAEDVFERASKRGDEASASAMFRTEQLRIVDPGIVPQRPSFPNLPLAVVSALAIAAVLCLAWLTLQFGFMRKREQPSRTALRVAGSGGR